MTVMRTGVIGFGTSGRVFHAPFIEANPDFSLDIIVTANAERAAVAASLYPDARIVASADELFAAELDLVIIGSPSGTHVSLAHSALDAGLAVVIDKPFSVTEAEGLGLIDRAEELGLPITVFQNRRWDGDFLTLRSLIASGELGDIRRFESRFEWWKPDVTKSWKAEATPAEGGGILYDLGAHLIDQAIQLFGGVTEVYSEVATQRPGGAADDDVFVSLLHQTGVRSQLWMNGLAAQVGPRFHVLGSASAYTKWGLDGQEPALIAGALPSDADYGVEPSSSWGVSGIGDNLSKVPAVRGQYDTYYGLLADSLLRGQPLPVDPRDSVEVIRIIEEIHRRHAS
ncbi:Gfo/Idh/MocA family oxidoreductase [Salinibacterium sp. NK8237]|uniref:Gfo/Idh/MocA family protein n=1 Tax=Salinibacterium sp. NK8237 TaxID=2792038 RepID=UPI0018CFD776|nr:Gfo/Idh/MocA family oxidoreductase [Salinibacterium sp. NK8237]MBH0129553.1 Gfo/Idh/MocA family oxidoreductase [Salinibacterium sp. NK8237]